MQDQSQCVKSMHTTVMAMTAKVNPSRPRSPDQRTLPGSDVRVIGVAVVSKSSLSQAKIKEAGGAG